MLTVPLPLKRFKWKVIRYCIGKPTKEKSLTIFGEMVQRFPMTTISCWSIIRKVVRPTMNKLKWKTFLRMINHLLGKNLDFQLVNIPFFIFSWKILIILEKQYYLFLLRGLCLTGHFSFVLCVTDRGETILAIVFKSKVQAKLKRASGPGIAT